MMIASDLQIPKAVKRPGKRKAMLRRSRNGRLSLCIAAVISLLFAVAGCASKPPDVPFEVNNELDEIMETTLADAANTRKRRTYLPRKTKEFLQAEFSKRSAADEFRHYFEGIVGSCVAENSANSTLVCEYCNSTIKGELNYFTASYARYEVLWRVEFIPAPESSVGAALSNSGAKLTFIAAIGGDRRLAEHPFEANPRTCEIAKSLVERLASTPFAYETHEVF